MHLRCDGIFNAQFITQSLPSLEGEKMKIGQHLPKLWAIKYRVVFNETLCTLKVQRVLLYNLQFEHCYSRMSIASIFPVFFETLLSILYSNSH